MGLADARRKRDEAREKLRDGVDPGAERKRAKLVAIFNAANTFGDIAKEYIDKMVLEGRADATTSKANWLLEQLAPIAASPIADLKPVEVLAALKRIEAKGKHETARRCRSFAGRVFRYAVAPRRILPPSSAARSLRRKRSTTVQSSIPMPWAGCSVRSTTMPAISSRASPCNSCLMS